MKIYDAGSQPTRDDPGEACCDQDRLYTAHSLIFFNSPVFGRCLWSICGPSEKLSDIPSSARGGDGVGGDGALAQHDFIGRNLGPCPSFDLRIPTETRR